jgi:hypothetical protein
MGARLDVTYRCDKSKGTPRFVRNEDIQRMALQVRRQIGCGDRLRIKPDDLLTISEIDSNGIRYEVCWSVDGPVTNERGEPVLGLCEYDPDGLPGTALIFANPEGVAGSDALLISTLAHELGHGVFDAPGWIVACQNEPLPGLFGHTPRRMSRTITPNEAHLTATNMNQGIVRNFPEWRANEFIGSSVVPRGLLLRLLQHQAARIGIPPRRNRSCFRTAADHLRWRPTRDTCSRVAGTDFQNAPADPRSGW